VRIGGGRQPDAALEVFFDYSPVAREIRATVTPIAIALGLALLLLYATLLPILRQVTKTLAARNQRLAEHADALRRALEERSDVEDRLSAAERQYRTLIEQLPLVTYIDNLDATSSAIYISPQVEEMLGYPVVTWLSDPEFFPKVLHPDDRERVLDVHWDAYQNGRIFTDEYRVVAKDGRVVWVQDHVMVVSDAQGKPLHAQGFLVDITERKHAEKELERGHDELAALHETAVALIDELDLEKLLELILTRAGALAGTDHCYVYLREGQSEELVVRLGTGVFSDKVGYTLRKGEGLAGRVWESGAPHAVADYHAWSGHSPGFERDPFHAIVGVPLFSRREVVGVLGLAYEEEERAFGEAEVAFLSRFAHLASIALENARLYSTARASEETFKALVSNIPGAIFRCAFDKDWTMLFLSEAIEDITGYPASDFLHSSVRTYASVVHPDDAEMLEQAVGDGAPYGVEYRILHADGSVRWVLERGQAVKDAAGDVWLDGAIFDITEQKGAEDERLKLAAIVESTDDAIMSASLDGIFTSWNNGAARMFGYDAEDVLGQSVTILTPPDREGEAARLIARVLEGERVVNYETQRLHKDGTAIDVSFTYSAILDASGRAVGVSAIAQDISERRRAEAAVRESETKFRAFVETTKEWVWALDAGGRLSYANPAVEQILGYAPKEILGRLGVDLVHEDDRDRVTWVTADAGAQREGWHGLILRWRHKDGSYRHLESTATAIFDPDGVPSGFRGTNRDVTGRILAEAERESLLEAAEKARVAAEAAQRDLAAQNERLRELDKLKDEFIALVSHELRTPLTSIRGYTELLLDETAGELSDDQRQFLEVVERNSHRLLHLVGDLLFLAQIEAGKLVLEIGALDMGSIASESVEAARPAAEEKRITLTLATGPVPLLAADRARMGQLLDNLVSNAVKFTPEGGRVDVRLRTLKGCAVVEVRDSGIGIPQAEKRFLFQRFFRTSTATEHAIQGTGLGLAISKAIVEAHGGEIAVESVEGEGTTFRVTFPLQQGAAEAQAAEVAS
jgi:PAS domain S-box-containing protein